MDKLHQLVFDEVTDPVIANQVYGYALCLRITCHIPIEACVAEAKFAIAYQTEGG